MLKNITIGQYIQGKSFLHEMDPRIKILNLMGFMILIFAVSSYYAYLFLYIFVLSVILFSKIPLKYTLKGVRPILYLCIFTFIINLIYIKTGTELASFWIIHIYSDAIISSSKVLLKLTLLVISASLLTLTTTPIVLTDGLEKLLKPIGILGISSHEIAMMMTIALRFIPTLAMETDRIMKAQASRGADFDTGNIFRRIRSFIPVIIPLIAGAFKRAIDLADAMESRCYRGGKGRTRLRQLKIGRVDFISVIVMISAVGGMIIFSKLYRGGY